MDNEEENDVDQGIGNRPDDNLDENNELEPFIEIPNEDVADVVIVMPEENEPNIPENERIQFDITATSHHQYLQADDQPDIRMTECWIDDTKSVKVPLIRQNIVILPGQVVPLKFVIPSDRQAAVSALNSKAYLALQTCFEFHRHGWFFNEEDDNTQKLHGDIGTLLLIKQLKDDGLNIDAILVGVQRCRFLKLERTITGSLFAFVEIVSDQIMPQLEVSICPNNLRKLTEVQKRSLIEVVGGIPSIASKVVSLDKNCKALAEWMKHWHSEDQINNWLNRGPEAFSFWVSKNLPLNLREKYDQLKEHCTDQRIINLLKSANILSDLACVRCEQKVSKIDNIIKMSSDSISEHFVNNHGFVHDLITVNNVENIERVGRPQSEYSWFAGYKWTILQCTNCHHHIGWEFTSKQYLPPVFYALTKNGIQIVSHHRRF